MTSVPEVLNQDGSAKWGEIMERFAGKKRGPNMDLVLAYCTAYQRWMEAERFVAEHGTVITIRDDKGIIKSHGATPQLRIAESSCKEMTRIGKSLGLND